MEIIISDKWLEATGNLHLSGVALPARLDQQASLATRLGNCYVVERPDGTSWVVYAARGVTVLEDDDEPTQRAG